MKPLSEEELSKSAWEDFLNCQEVDDDAINAYIYGYKRGYAKCIKQMQDGFNELLVACNTSMNRLKWISVEDSLPEDNECCLIYGDCGIDIGSYNSKTQYWLSEYSGQPTHWMPLPASPATEGGEQ